ncbi:MAG: S9 family peptidase [Gemmatimonadota bacterium]|nr:S9 family peptidase [Gemmatimonadota bacterium]
MLRPAPISLTLLLAGTLMTTSADAQVGTPVVETPNPSDIPQPVAGEASLAGSDRPDITRFLNVRRAYAPSLAPDGRQVAFRTQISGTPQLWVVDAAGGWPKQLTFGESVTFHAWSPAGEWIVYGTDRGGNEREGFYLITPDGTTERELLPPSDAFRQFGAFTRDGRRIVYATTARTGVDFDIHLLDVERGADREIFRGRMGLYAVSFSPDGRHVLLSESRGEDANDLFLLDVATGRLDTLFAPEDRSSYAGFAWTPDGSGFYLASDQEREFAGLAYYDVAVRSLRWIDTPAQDVEDVGLSPDGHLLVWSVNGGGYTYVLARDLRTGATIPPPDLPPGVARVTWAEQANVAAFSATGPQVPGDIWIWRPERGTTTRVTISDAAGLDLARMVIPTHYDFTARDGVTLHGLLYLPPGLAPGVKPPVLLGVHGGPTAQARPEFDPAVQYLLTRGIAYFDLNFRGSTGYGKQFARLNDGRLRGHEYLDMEDAVRWLGEEGLADASRAAVMGGSYGGYLTMAAMTRLPEVFRSGVAFVGVANWVTALEGASPQLKASDRIEYGDIDDPDDRRFFAEISPIAHVKDVRAPVMVLHGANDPRDPVTESDQFVRGIREIGGEVEYLRFPDEGHGIRRLANRIIAYRRIAAFLERTLGVGMVP